MTPSEKKIEELARRFEVAVLRLEALLERPLPKVDQKAVEAAEKYIERRKHELLGVESFDE